MYLCISIGSVTPTGDQNKYKLEKSICTCISSVQYTRYLSKNKSAISIRSDCYKYKFSTVYKESE